MNVVTFEKKTQYRRTSKTIRFERLQNLITGMRELLKLLNARSYSTVKLLYRNAAGESRSTL